MPNEIYHRSNWGESKAEDFGDVYYDHAATNKLYNHSDYYENSNGTDATLKDLNNKASIVLTPTAYSDGSLNTVIPPYQVFEERVVNGDFSDGTNGWVGNFNTTLSVSNGQLDIQSINASGKYGVASSEVNFVEGKKYIVKLDVISTDRPTHIRVGTSSTVATGTPQNIFASGDIGIGSHEKIFTATSTDTYLAIGGRNDMTTLVIDNVSVREVTVADFDFSRGSSATRVNEQGLVEDVQILSGELVQNGNFEQIGSELVTNGNFSDGLTGWNNNVSFPVDYLSVVDDRLELENINGGTQVFTSNSFSVTANKIYKISLDTIKVSGADDFDITLRNTPLGTTVETITTTQQTGELIYYFKSASTQSLVFQFTLRDTIKGSIDNVSVKEVAQNWTPNTNATLSIDSGRLKVAISGGSGYPSQNIITEVGKTYKVTADAFIGTSSRLAFFTNADSQFRNLYADGSFNFTFVATSTSTQLRLYVYDDGAYGFWDNVSVVKVTNDTDLPRIDFTDGTGSLLLEPQRTNSLPYSEDFTQWTVQSGTTITSNTTETLSPSGQYNASKIVSNGSVGFYKQVAVTGVVSRSIYLKSVTGTVNVKLKDPSLTVTTKTLLVTENWQRFELVESNGHASQSGLWVDDIPSSGIYAWAAQIESGDYATSYIPTSGSTVTRSADVANNSGNADLFNDSEGVLYAEIAALADDGTFRLISISDGTGSNRVYIGFRNNSNMITSIIDDGGSSQATFNYTVTDTKSYHKVAIKYKENDVQFYVDGQQVGTDTSATIPSGLNSLQFTSGALSSKFYGKVRNVQVFTEALTDEQLQKLTS